MLIKIRVWGKKATFKGQEWSSEDKGLEWFLNEFCGAYTIGYSPDWDSSAKELLAKKFADYELLEESEPPKKPEPRKPGDREIIY